jgi:transcriptional regulator with XRE-family HTH domain
MEEKKRDLYNNFTLKAIRVNKRLTQPEAAKLIGISTSTLGHYEHGEKYPTIPVIRRIEEVYNISILTDTVNFLERR